MKNSLTPALEEAGTETKKTSPDAVDLVSLQYNHKGGKEGLKFSLFDTKNTFVDQGGLHQLCSETTPFLLKVSDKTPSLVWKCNGCLVSDFLSECFFGSITPCDLEGKIQILVKFVGAGGEIQENN